MKEITAKGKVGFILSDGETYFFRTYKDTTNEQGHKEFTDYKICAEDFEVELIGDFVSLYEGEENKLDYSSKVLGKNEL